MAFADAHGCEQLFWVSQCAVGPAFWPKDCFTNCFKNKFGKSYLPNLHRN